MHVRTKHPPLVESRFIISATLSDTEYRIDSRIGVQITSPQFKSEVIPKFQAFLRIITQDATPRSEQKTETSFQDPINTMSSPEELMNDPNLHRAAFYKGFSARHVQEYDRLRMQHELQKHAQRNKLIQVPLSKTEPVRILDSATGDGFWMLDVCEEFSNATFMGTDIEPKHFEKLKGLDNIKCKAQSVTNDWPQEDKAAYDLVHQRYCLAVFTYDQSAEAVKRLFELVKPGGYIQLVEADLLGYISGSKHPGMTELMKYMKRAFVEMGGDPAPGPNVKSWLDNAGAVDITEQVMSFELGCAAPTPELRQMSTANLSGMIDNFASVGSSKSRYSLY